MKIAHACKKIFTILSLVIFAASVALPSATAFAQSVAGAPTPQAGDYYWYFKNLFNQPVSGVVSGVDDIQTAEGGTSAATKLKVISRLVIDDKNPPELISGKYTQYHYDLTADDNNDRFLVLLSYQYKDASGKLVPWTQVQAITSYEDTAGKTQSAFFDGLNQVKAIAFFADNADKSWYSYATLGISTLFSGTTDKNKVIITKQNPVSYFALPQDKPAAWGTNVTASFWYCAGKKGSSNYTLAKDFADDGQDATTNTAHKITDATIARTFIQDTTGIDKKYCGGTAYFKIGDDKTVALSLAYDPATVKDTPAVAAVTESHSDSLPACGLLPWDKKGTFMGCIALIVYHVIFRLTAVFAYLMGNIFDFFLGYSISSTAYIHPFVTSAWQTVRDIANIFFIVLLIYVAIGSIFGFKGVTKKLVGVIILNAILINFSLLITRGVIDISNIMARIFYAQIHVENKGSNPDTTVVPENSDSGYKGVSTIMLQSFDPQRVFDKALEGSSATEGGEGIAETGTANFGAQRSGLSAIRDSSPEEYAGYFTLVTLICAFIAFATGMIFWNIGFIFVGRVVGLYVSMIFSPFAFMSRDIPFLSILDKWSFSKWFKELSEYAIIAPMTVIYFYIVIKIMQTDFYSNKISDTNHSFTYTLLWIVIPLIIIYGLLDKGKKMIVDSAGELGKQFQGAMSKVAGIAGGAALAVGTGGLAYVGTRAGAAAGRGLANGRFGKWAAQNQDSDNRFNRFFARGITNTANKSQTASFDLRKSKAFQSASSTVFGGMGISKEVSKFGDVGAKSFEGGYKGRKEREDKKNQQDIEDVKFDKDTMTEKTAQDVWAKKQAEAKASVDNDFKRNYMDGLVKGGMSKKDAEDKMAADALVAGTEYHTKLAEHEAASEQAIKDKFGEVKNAEDLTLATRLLYAEKMASGEFEKHWSNRLTQLAGAAGAGVLTGGLLGAGAGVVGGGIVGVSSMDGSFESESKKRVAEKFAKNAKKAVEKDKAEEALVKKWEEELAKSEEFLETIDKDTKELIKDRLAIAVANPASKLIGKEVKDLSEIDIRQLIKEEKERYDDLIDSAQVEMEDKKKAFERASDAAKATAKDAYDTARKALNSAKNQASELENAVKDRDAARKKVGDAERSLESAEQKQEKKKEKKEAEKKKAEEKAAKAK